MRSRSFTRSRGRAWARSSALPIGLNEYNYRAYYFNTQAAPGAPVPPARPGFFKRNYDKYSQEFKQAEGPWQKIGVGARALGKTAMVGVKWGYKALRKKYADWKAQRSLQAMREAQKGEYHPVGLNTTPKDPSTRPSTLPVTGLPADQRIEEERRRRRMSQGVPARERPVAPPPAPIRRPPTAPPAPRVTSSVPAPPVAVPPPPPPTGGFMPRTSQRVTNAVTTVGNIFRGVRQRLKLSEPYSFYDNYYPTPREQAYLRENDVIRNKRRKNKRILSGVKGVAAMVAAAGIKRAEGEKKISPVIADIGTALAGIYGTHHLTRAAISNDDL